MKYQYNPRRCGSKIIDQVPIIDWNNAVIKCPCSNGQGFRRRDHFQDHINTKQHQRWVYNYKKNLLKKQIVKKEKKKNYFVLKFLVVYTVLMFYWFEPLTTWLKFNFLESNATKPIYEMMAYDDVYERYVNNNISFGGLTISW